MTGMKISDLTSSTKHIRSTKSTSNTTRTSSMSSNQKNNKWGNSRNRKNSIISHSVTSFKAANVDIHGKVFIKVPIQTSKYDEAYKTIVNYIGSRYDHYVYTSVVYYLR